MPIDAGFADGPLRGQTRAQTVPEPPAIIEILDDDGRTLRYAHTGGHELVDGEIVEIYRLET